MSSWKRLCSLFSDLCHWMQQLTQFGIDIPTRQHESPHVIDTIRLPLDLMSMNRVNGQHKVALMTWFPLLWTAYLLIDDYVSDWSLPSECVYVYTCHVSVYTVRWLPIDFLSVIWIGYEPLIQSITRLDNRNSFIKYRLCCY